MCDLCVTSGSDKLTGQTLGTDTDACADTYTYADTGTGTGTYTDTDSHLYHLEKQFGLYSFFSKIYDQHVVNVLVNR